MPVNIVCFVLEIRKKNSKVYTLVDQNSGKKRYTVAHIVDQKVN